MAKISIIVPVHNEAASLYELYDELTIITDTLPYEFEFVLVNDGSSDDSGVILAELAAKDERVKPIELVRNSGKEIALTAGFHSATGDAAITMDADLQHPPRYIPDFIAEWEKGALVVVGARINSEKRSIFRSLSTGIFYGIINYASAVKISPDIMDFRLVDREVMEHFNRFTERNRITRGLIDWLGYPQTLLPVEIPDRLHGKSTYSTRKLFKLATDSLVSMSLLPLRISGYLGIAIMSVFGPLGLYVIVEQAFLGDTLHVSTGASIGIFTSFMVGVLLVNLGLIALYVANMHDESLGRPLYIQSKRPVRARGTHALQSSLTYQVDGHVSSRKVADILEARRRLAAPTAKSVLWLSWKDTSHPEAGGAELLGTALRERLVADGVQVTLLTGSYPGAKAKQTVGGVQIIRMGNRYTVHFKVMMYYLKHRKLLDPELIIDEVNTAPFFASWYSRKPTKLFFHQLAREIWYHEMPPVLSNIGFITEAMYLRLLSKQGAITVSPSSKKDLMRFGFRDSRITVITEGIELTPVEDPTMVKKFSTPTLLSLGAVRSMKQTLDQVKAFEQAKRHMPELRLMIAGDASSPYGKKVENYIKKSKFSQDIKLLGRVSEARKTRLMQRSHWLLVSSVKEGWCLVVAEAASQGLPAIVYDADGLRDSVKHNITGYVVKPSPSAMAEAILDAFGIPRKDQPAANLLIHKNYSRIQKAAWDFSKTLTLDQAYTDFKSAIGVDG